jgi:replicative DNA helicase
MRAKSRRLMAEHGLDMLIIDYIQLMQGRGRFENRTLELAAISRSLKVLAKELNVPVVILSQLSRAPESRSDHRPMLSDLRECVTGDTLVMLTDGRRVPIRDLVDTAPEVWSVTSDGKLQPARSDRVWAVGRRPVHSIKLASGRTIRATADHRLLAGDGWKRVKELEPGDRLAVALAAAVEERGISQRRMAELRGTSYGGSSHFQFSPSRAVVLEYAELLEDQELRSAATSDLFWDRVVSIEAAGEEEVFDLTVPGPASWLADGIVSHNSGALEQDADVVMLLFRPDQYPDVKPEDENIAEVNVAKQRNGPTGHIRLAFLKSETRFGNLDQRQ